MRTAKAIPIGFIKRRLALALVLGLAWSSGTAAAETGQACTAALIRRGWAPFTALAGDAAPAESLNLLRRELRLQQSLLMDTRLDPRTRELKNKLWNSLRDFDLQGLYELLPEKQGPWHALTLSGRYTRHAYAISQTGSSAVNAALTAFGAMAAQFAMRPRLKPSSGPGGDIYALRQRLRVNIGPISWDSALKALQLGLAHISQAASIAPSRAELAKVDTLTPGLPASDQKILAQLRTAFPATWRWYARIGSVPSLRVHDGPSDADHLHLALELDDAALASRYPQVERYLKGIGDSVSARLVIKNAKGRWLDVNLDTQHRRLTLDGWAADGRLVPSRGGRPVISEIGAKWPRRLSWTSVADLRFKALGVTVLLKHLPGQWQYHQAGRKATVVGVMNQPPEVGVKGRVLGVLPTSWVEHVMPINIENTVSDFMQVLTRSNDGRGAVLRMTYSNPHGHGRTVSALADGDGLDNFFVHFGLSLINKRLLPDKKESRGLRHLFHDELLAWGKDLDGRAALKPRGTPAGCSSGSE